MNVLAIGAHHDDIELGAGGTLAKLVKDGHKVYGLVLTNSETHYEIAGIHRSREQALEEAQIVAGIVGFTLLPAPEEFAANVGELEYSSKYMRSIEDIVHQNKIELVFCHWLYDMNDDHRAASRLSIAAARHLNKILMYRSNWYQVDRPFNPLVYCDISETIETKKKALLSYKVEVKNRGEDWIQSFIDANRTFGFTISTNYAEVFEPVRYSI